MAFETFDKRSAAATKSPMVTLQRGGPFSLNKAAHHLVGSPEAVELLYDKENELIGFKPASSSSPRAFPVRPQGPNGSTLMIAGQAFAKYYGIDTSKARRYGVEKRDNILILDLNSDSVEVTGPRLGSKSEANSANHNNEGGQMSL